MPVTIVDHPSKVPMDPDVWPWAVRSKYGTVQELLNDYIAANAAIGRQVCPVSDYFRAHLDADVLEVEAYVYAHEEWGPPTLCESMHQTLRFNNETSGPHGIAVAAWAQHYLALTLVRLHPWERARPAVQEMLYNPRMRFVSPAAAYVIMAFFNANHANPRRFLGKPEVIGKFPGIDLERFAAPDFEPVKEVLSSPAA